MSVSEGMKKVGSKNYFVKLLNLEKDCEIFENKKGVKIQPWTKVTELKNKISKFYGVTLKNIRLYFQNLEMIDSLSMLDYGLIDKKNPEIHYQISSENKDIYLSVYAAFPCTQSQRKLIEDIRHGFMEGLAPNMILQGTSGTYNLRNTNKEVVALFKPIDEEAFAPNNQKGYQGRFGQESFRKGVLSGEGSIREVAAFLLDKQNSFNVPETTFVEISHPSFNRDVNELLALDNSSLPKMRNSIVHNFILENVVSMGMALQMKSFSKKDSQEALKSHSNIRKKYGSLQKFIKANDVAANFSSSLYEVNDVHKIGVLDIRILNCDRNDENILVIKKKEKISGKIVHRLIPIDHSLSFPDCIKIQEYEMCWMGWDQAQKPFSKEMLAYISKIDILSDMKRLSSIIKLRDQCWKNFRIANLVLKIGAAYGLNLYEIGMLLYKPGFEEDINSEVENLIEKTEKLCSLYSNISKDTLINFLNKEESTDDYSSGKNQTSELVDQQFTFIMEEDNKQDINKISTHSDSSVTQTQEEKPIQIQVETRGKKKNSLLKRTASEPNLTKTDEVKEENLNIDKLNIFTQDEKPQFRKSFKEDPVNKNFKKSKKLIKQEDDSPYNEIFFYNFENALVDFLQKKYKLK